MLFYTPFCSVCPKPIVVYDTNVHESDREMVSLLQKKTTTVYPTIAWNFVNSMWRAGGMRGEMSLKQRVDKYCGGINKMVRVVRRIILATCKRWWRQSRGRIPRRKLLQLGSFNVASETKLMCSKLIEMVNARLSRWPWMEQGHWDDKCHNGSFWG
jgi:hypothetical protein